jgi:palmitoyltransferase ZDHHC9/14/18
MTSEGSPPTLQRPGDSDAFPNPLAAHLETGDAVSILSSRMTDVASDDGGERAVDSAASVNQRHSKQLPTGEASRPTTAATGISSQRDTLSRATSSRRGYVSPASAQRASQSTGLATTASGRPPSSTSRTHVPSLTSHAFFRPMSSQRLQAQRGGSRPATMSQQGLSEDGSVEGSIVGQAVPQEASTFDDSELQRPHSRGTQMTEQETSERITANTSPTNGHNAAESTSESVRPLQRNNTNPKGLSINLDKSYKSGGGLPTPSKSPHSFRSGFLLPARGDIAPSSPNRSAHGREKLSSVASSPAFTPTNLAKVVSGPKLGSNYQYFTGNTVFCWGGRLQNTRHRPINIATGLIVTIPSVLFYIFSAPWLWHNVSPAIPIVFAYIFYITMSSFIHASVSDPGVSFPVT